MQSEEELDNGLEVDGKASTPMFIYIQYLTLNQPYSAQCHYP